MRGLLLDLAGSQEKLQSVGVGKLLLQRLNVFFADVLRIIVSEKKKVGKEETAEFDEEGTNLRQALDALLVFHFLHCSLPVALHHRSRPLVC